MKKLLLLMPMFIFAAVVNLKVNKTNLNTNEELIITITAKGKNIEFPNISNIAGFNVIGTSTTNNITIINGEMQESVSKTFIIIPTKSFTLPPFKIIVDGKTYKTKPLKITVTEPKQTKGDFEIDLNVSKKELFIGENAILTLKFIQKKPADSIRIQKPEIPNFIVKNIAQKNIQNGIIYKFLIIPQKTGEYKIGPITAQIGKIVKTNPFNDPFFNISSIRYTPIYSNSVMLKVKSIPQNSVFGDFHINIKAKKEVKANEPNKAVLTLKGCGDFYNLPDFNLNIPNATVYKEKPKIKTFIKNENLCGELKEEFTIIADSNYTISPLSLKEFNGSVTKTISTKPIKVYVKNPHPQKISPVNKTDNKPNTKPLSSDKNVLYIILALTGGIAVGVFSTLLVLRKKRKEPNLITKIKKASQKELFNLLIPYGEHPEIKKTLTKLEENIYKKANHKINKKEIIKILKRIKED